MALVTTLVIGPSIGGAAPAGPVAAYSFDAGSGSVLADASGNGRTGTISGAAWTSAGRNAGALTFDGANDLVTVADAAPLDLKTGMTLEAWVRPSRLGDWRTVVFKQRTNGVVYGLYADQAGGRPLGQVYVGDERNVVGPSSLPLNAWSHLATTYDGAVVRLYVNGVLAGSHSFSGSMAASTGPLSIGGNNVWSEWFQGQIDDVRIYNRALTASELQADMNTPVGASPPVADTQDPSTPAGLTVSGQTQTALTLSWNASTDNVGVTGYDTYEDGSPAGSTASGTRTYTFTDLTCGTTYALAVDAEDAAGNRSGRASVNGATSACPPPPPSGSTPIAAYSFNAGTGSVLADSSGSGNNGTISGAAWTAAGRSGGALTFDGVNDLVTIADKASLDLTTGMTLEAWVRPTANSTWRTIVTKEKSGNLVYGLFSNSDSPEPSSIVTIGSNPIQDITRGQAEAPLSSWTHLATTYDGSVLRLYVNGTQAATKNVTGAMANSTGPLQIGGNNVWAEWFQGQIDDLRIYNRALTPSQLQTDMNTPVAPPPAGDAQAPSTPAGLAVSGQTQTALTLAWNASTDNVGVTGYDTYRNSSGAGTTVAGTRTYTFTGLACATTYALGVEALDAAGNRSGRASVNGTTSACSAPPPPPPPPPPPAGTINVAPGGNLSAAYSQAQDGWTIQLAAGDYGVWKPGGGAKRVTVKGVSGTRFRQLYSNFDNIIFDGLNIDAGRAKTEGGAAFESHGDNVTFRNGQIGNVTDEKGALVSGANFTFDNVLFHDVRLATPGVHNECIYAIVVPGFTIRNSTFRNCVTMDLFFTYGSWWSPLPPQYENVTVENNSFGRSVYPDEVGTHAAGLYIARIGPSGEGTMNGWKIRNNWFENDVYVSPARGSNNVFCGNTGKPPSGWAAGC